MSYEEFLLSKTPKINPVGVPVEREFASLYPWQRVICSWALRRGRAALFCDTGLGKTRLQLEWAAGISGASQGRVLIVAPLGVVEQTIAEGARIGVSVLRARESADVKGAGIYITNYDRLHKFDPGVFHGIVLDESSILKSVDGAIKTRLTEEWVVCPYRLCCTATPAPNDITELANHAEFLGICTRQELLATYFVHDSTDTAKAGWRLKGHASAAFYKFLALWSVYLRRPSDIGYPDGAYIIPPLTIEDVVVPAQYRKPGELFSALGGITGRSEVRKVTLSARVARAKELIESSGEQWLVWCGLNEEGRALAKALSSVVLIEGSDTDDQKLSREASWRSGEVRTLISKPSIFGFGMNWQHCHNMIFLGMNDSYEQYYQAIRRCYRYGQKHPVNVKIVLSDIEGQIAANVRRKEEHAAQTAAEVVSVMKDVQIEGLVKTDKPQFTYKTDYACGRDWELFLGDSVERIKEVASASVGLTIFSPPFASLYTYSASERDMGNCASDAEFFEHFKFLIPELLRVTKPGRTVVVHCQEIVNTITTHGFIGKRDFPGELIRAFQAVGWRYDGRITIDKNPQSAAIRSKSKQLLFVQKERDANWLMTCLADYLLRFRHPADNAEPVRGDITNEEWITYAHPVWYDITESETLQASPAREQNDEKHVCPLQLEPIKRCIRLWTNKGDLVLDPFNGIGSVGYVALQQGRQYLGIELKESYFKQALKNLTSAVSQQSLFSI